MLRLIALLAVLANPALAHSPVLDLSPKTRETPLVLDEPEHSKAIFSELTGAPQFYQITSNEEFDFYVGITAAKLESCGLKQTFSFRVLDEGFKEIDARDGAAMEWAAWYEEFGKTWYWVGPEIGKAFAHDRQYPAGVYYVEVFNKGNTGEYVLAVGDQERFGLGTLLTIRGTMREVQAKFWDEKGCEGGPNARVGPARAGGSGAGVSQSGSGDSPTWRESRAMPDLRLATPAYP